MLDRDLPHLPQAADLLAQELLGWYDRHRRRLPWRANPGVNADPYAVWLSEIMLQQTTVAAVKPYYEQFLARWPTVGALAAAPIGEVMAAWAGLGYYARARNLHKCANVVAHDHGGRFPDTEEGLRTLPGIGGYTAAAIAAIAFGRRAVVVDGNVERVMARLFAITEPLPAAKTQLKERAGTLTPDARCGDYAQAVMDLGATVCTPKSPKCMICPWANACRARAEGIAETLPRRSAKAETPQRFGVAFWMVRADGAVFLRRREAKGLLGGMMEIPSTDWRAKKGALTEAPVEAKWRTLDGEVRHTFTHFRLTLTVATANIAARAAAKLAKEGVWVKLERIGDAGLPSVMRKVATHAMKAIE